MQINQYQYEAVRIEAQRAKAAVSVIEKGNSNVKTERTDFFERTKIFENTSDVATTAAEKTAANGAKNISAFKQMVQAMLQDQGLAASGSLDALVKIDEQTQLAAQEAISENGYWGVNKTADRILDFAKSISGGDLSKISLIRNAFLDGFTAAEEAWGGRLPDISYLTRDRVLQALDEWEKGSAGGEEATSEPVNADD
ncbi:MAG: hypothetical protein LBT26_01105 [Clostridiales Family XIII bacterium]|jgi:hypothetical protein|nr:hypothetical protein [Clostridiales Family XIII bacterium]